MRARNLVPMGLVVAGVVAAYACGGSKSTSPGGSSGSNNNGSNGSGTTATANESDTITASDSGNYSSGNTTYKFSPTPDTVSSGTTMSFKFGDVQHTVIWDTQGAPDSIPPTSNAVVQLTFSTSGSFNYHCRIHTYMTGTVVVK
jgi:plastocyanin